MPQDTPLPDSSTASTSSNAPDAADIEANVRLLRRKEENWVEWGQACAKLQKAGYSTQRIFEETGFEPVQQNQVTVASQVYISLVNGGAAAAVLSHFQHRGSDILYEFRILTQAERVAAAELALAKKLDADEARDIAKAMKDVSRLKMLPAGFSQHPGDAVAYFCWKAARQHNDLQERSRLIARGLKFVHSEAARHQIEQLLTDFTVVSQRVAPRLPVYRLESDDELPRIVPVVGQWPLTLADLQAVPLVEETGSFKLVKFSGNGAWVPLPGWQVVMKAEDPVAILSRSDQLPAPLPGEGEEALVIIDRSQRQWSVDHYFLIEQSGQLELQWFEEAPDFGLLGQVILVMRPKKVLDEEFIKEQWQIDE